MPLIEQQISPDVLKEFEWARAKGAQLVKLVGNESPSDIVIAVEKGIDDWQDRRRRKGPFVDPGHGKPGVTDYALWLSTQWGDQLVRQFNWEWTCIVHEGKDWYAVVSPDRSLVIYPSYFVKACLDDPNVDCTIVLAFNMLVAGSIGGMPPNSYTDMMSGVRRVVPKR